MNTLNQVLLIEDNPGDARLVSEYLRERFGDSCASKQAKSLPTGLHCLESAAYASLPCTADAIDRGAAGPVGHGTVRCHEPAGHRARSYPRWQIDPVPSAAGDPRLVEVLLNHLLSNASKHSAKASPAGAIHFGRLRLPSQAAVTTYVGRDNGIGFDPSDAGERFTPFHRKPAASTYVGSGGGLATARRAAERHGGSVRAESRPRAGACFYFTLKPEPAYAGQP